MGETALETPGAAPVDPTRSDIVVLGGSLTAGMLAAVLARHGVRVLLLDPGVATRPGRGVTTLPFSSFFSELIAARYDVPEIAQLADAERVRSEISSLSGMQRTIGFAMHTAGSGFDPGLSMQFNLPSEHGESHLHQPDVEAWMRQIAVRYGARVRTGVAVRRAVTHPDSVELLLDDDERVLADCIVDAHGSEAVASILSSVRRTPLDRPSPRLVSARVQGLPGFERWADPLRDSPRWSAGVLHHVLDGGWLIVTPFDNADRSPDAASLADLTFSAAEQQSGDDVWASLLNRVGDYPEVREQFARVRPLEVHEPIESCWVASRRSADRVLLLDRAALGGDPLFARDLTTSAELVHSAAGDLLSAWRDGDFRAQRFAYLDRLQLGMARTQHRVALAAAAASTEPALWSMLSRVWLLGTMFAALTVKRALKLHATPAVEAALNSLREGPDGGTSYPVIAEYRDLWEAALTECERYAAGASSARLATRSIANRVRAARVVPPIFGFADLSDQVYSLGLRKRLRTMRWAREQAPEGVRRLLLSYGLQGEGRAA
ncbi:NAD(P)/FAD-dependent oxidoreductase [Pseudonocardia sp. MH-G8]|uniref:NAD(P)/FAD-dependent oxidoreductase n=1 Tax=Pseudonocardia sp. MH-G8 TaxID=1854588 RepID=UPI000BA024D5|nr:hypothetical protein [Pseudonocardia sp. MH-G8]OZM83065.1 hypothetical protein CFP66_00330 [Pseudonocardia sp. MH-G8]